MPNTKTKKFDFQIFLAVFCILLVICSATFCCVVSNTNKGVARADEPVYDTWDVNGGFYTKKITNRSDLQSIVNYYFSFIPESQDIKIGSYIIGKLRFAYINGSNSFETVDLFMSVDLASISAINYTYFTIKLYDSSMENTIDFITIIDDGTFVVTANYWQSYSSSSSDNYYFYSLTGDWTNSGNFLNRFLTFALGSVSDFQELVSFGFSTYSTASIRWLVSQTDVFDDIPLPPGGNDEELQAEINRLTGIIQSQREELEYYRSLDLNYQEIQVFNIARVKPSIFVYDGVTYTSNSIVRTNDGWDVYSSTYLNEELPENYGVGFSLFLEDTIINSKFHIYPDILSWYNYTYCSPPAQDGSQECYQVNERNIDFSVGYRTQNGNIVKIGEFSNAPGMTTGNFVINQPTNEIVFFSEESNLMQIGNLFSLITYQFDTESIYNDGYENGKTQGIQIGRQEGYNQGVLDANDYSFFSLFTSVFDAPISAIVGKWGDSDGDGVYQREGGMLNFYIPGLDINFAPFLLSLFTIAIIILVIRFIMARKS